MIGKVEQDPVGADFRQSDGHGEAAAVFTKPTDKGALDAGSWQFFIHHGIPLNMMPTVSKLMRWNVSHAVAGFTADNCVTYRRSTDHTGIFVTSQENFMPVLIEHIPEVTFFYCPLDKAMENAAHDEPGFWQRWAENF